MLFGKKINHHFAHVVYKWMAYKQKPLIYKLICIYNNKNVAHKHRYCRILTNTMTYLRDSVPERRAVAKFLALPKT